jgi:hypothetical protein
MEFYGKIIAELKLHFAAADGFWPFGMSNVAENNFIFMFLRRRFGHSVVQSVALRET